MFFTGVVRWWYAAGWRERAGLVGERLARTLDFFSINLLLKTLFAPFRQISAANTTGPISVRMHAFFDKLISRFIGAFMRLILIFVGLITIVAQLLWGMIVLIVWIILPIIPVVGLILFSIGWMPL
jgi:hypothetical protein